MSCTNAVAVAPQPETQPLSRVRLVALEGSAKASMKRARESDVHEATKRALTTWAAQKRLCFIGKEGFAPRSVVGKIREEAEGASQNQVARQRWPEVYFGDGWHVQRIISTFRHRPRMVGTCHYLFHRSGGYYVALEEQLEHLGMKRDAYWEDLGKFNFAMDCGLQIVRLYRPTL